MIFYSATHLVLGRFSSATVNSANKKWNIKLHRLAPSFCSRYLRCTVQLCTATQWTYPALITSHDAYSLITDYFSSDDSRLQTWQFVFQRILHVTVLTFHVGGSTWHRVPPLGRMHQRHQMMHSAVVTLVTTSDRQTSSRQHWNQQSALARHTTSRLQAYPIKNHHHPAQCMHFQLLEAGGKKEELVHNVMYTHHCEMTWTLWNLDSHINKQSSTKMRTEVSVGQLLNVQHKNKIVAFYAEAIKSGHAATWQLTWPLNMEAWVRSQYNPCGICVWQSGTKTDLSPNVPVFPSVSFHWCGSLGLIPDKSMWEMCVTMWLWGSFSQICQFSHEYHHTHSLICDGCYIISAIRSIIR